MVIFMQAMIYYITQQFTTLLVFYCLQVLCVCSVASGGVGKVHRQRQLGSFAPGDTYMFRRSGYIPSLLLQWSTQVRIPRAETYLEKYKSLFCKPLTLITLARNLTGAVEQREQGCGGQVRRPENKSRGRND